MIKMEQHKMLPDKPPKAPPDAECGGIQVIGLRYPSDRRREKMQPTNVHRHGCLSDEAPAEAACHRKRRFSGTDAEPEDAPLDTHRPPDAFNDAALAPDLALQPAIAPALAPAIDPAVAPGPALAPEPLGDEGNWSKMQIFTLREYNRTLNERFLDQRNGRDFIFRALTTLRQEGAEKERIHRSLDSRKEVEKQITIEGIRRDKEQNKVEKEARNKEVAKLYETITLQKEQMTEVNPKPQTLYPQP
jgi:hypothetical protein